MQVEATGTRDRLSVNNSLVKFMSFLLGTNLVSMDFLVEQKYCVKCRILSYWSH